MSSGFPGGYPDFYTPGGINGRSMMNLNNSHVPYRPSIAGIMPDPASLLQRRSDLIGKRSLADFQQQFQQQQQLGIYLRNVKQRVNYQQHTSPISTLSPPFDFSGNSELSSISSNSSPPRFGVPLYQQLRQPFGVPIISGVGVDSEKKMMSRLQDLEKELLDDNDEEENVGVSVVTNSEWSETIQNLIAPGHNNHISPASSCSSSSASPPVNICPKQSLLEAASAISDGKNDVAIEALTRLIKLGNTKGTSEQRLVTYMASALMSRVNSTEYPPHVSELYAKDHAVSVQMLYEISPCFKLGFMAANLTILEEAVSDDVKLHVIDFNIGQGGQYLHLLHALAAKKKNENKSISLKITTLADYTYNGSESRLKIVGDGLKVIADKFGVSFIFEVMDLKICELTSHAIGVQNDEVLAVNLGFRLFMLPDESVTTENLRDELLRRVKALSPKVVTVVEQDMNGNTAPFVIRVKEVLGYYGALFDSLDAILPRDQTERVRIEEGLSRKMCNSVACEGRDRVERCEVFGKWKARMGMAGFEAKKMSQLAESLRVKLNSGTRGNPGFTVKEEAGGVSFGWMARTLTVASAWR